MGKYFGTDGARGVANVELTAELAYRIGVAAAWVLTRELQHRPCFFIGRDTRISGNMLEAALEAGICAAGVDVVSLGVLPTPAVAYLTSVHQTDAGFVISASHNPFEHNGIKIFGSRGYKLSDEQEEQIEHYIDNPPAEAMATGAELGRITHLELSAEVEYTNHIIKSAPGRIEGMRIILDCANGAASQTAERIFSALGADVTLIHHSPNGVNINEGCGSTHMDDLCARVVAGGYDLGAAFDGDADRCLLVDERGRVIDGDCVLALLADKMHCAGSLRGGVSATVMSNLGLRSFCRERGIEVGCTKVGDRYVLEEMLEKGWNLGGEQSGHVILSDHATTGDGQLTAAHFLCMVAESGKKASELRDLVPSFPQVTVNVPAPNSVKKQVADLPAVREVAAQIEKAFGADGRILIRPSGTEALVRVMVEGRDEEQVRTWVQRAADVIRQAVAEL
ncbi:MAG TPA: phosphoglucosamine mutase [Candidatus Ventrousia excrementavium]|uniref:Phosphoglucosamine mutase n=1 Tax=Candidatus Ventrousia excrementavium TaxID=2840961 RepID=A0A9D1IUT2_9CLOT|nr:phosphoglucosamine mutase [Candidatus Ventrousia excrementavium]